MTTTKSLRIGLIGICDLLDPMLYEAFELMSQNLGELNSYDKQDNGNSQKATFLRYRFTKYLLILQADMGTSNMLETVPKLINSSDGIIISLGGAAIDSTYLDSDYFMSLYLKRIVSIIIKAGIPTVFALEDVRDSCRAVTVFWKSTETSNDYRVEDRPITAITTANDIWETDSPTISSIRHVLNISETISIIPYTYRWPITIQKILLHLIADIDAQQYDSSQKN